MEPFPGKKNFILKQNAVVGHIGLGQTGAIQFMLHFRKRIIVGRLQALQRCAGIGAKRGIAAQRVSDTAQGGNLLVKKVHAALQSLSGQSELPFLKQGNRADIQRNAENDNAQKQGQIAAKEGQQGTFHHGARRFLFKTAFSNASNVSKPAQNFKENSGRKRAGIAIFPSLFSFSNS